MVAASERSVPATRRAPGPRKARANRFSPLERRLIDLYQRRFPLETRPYRAIAKRLGVAETAVIDALERLLRRGVVGRIGAVVAPHRIGRSTLAALAVPKSRLAEVAAVVAAFPDVNHLYEREHALNLWFVVTASAQARVEAVLSQIARRTGLEPLDLPLEAAYHIDLGFPIQWN